MKIVLITGNDEEPNALRAVEQGAADFFSKPVDRPGAEGASLRASSPAGGSSGRTPMLLQPLGEERRLGR